MQENYYRGLGMSKFICTASFILFGIVSFMTTGDEFNWINLTFGVLMGLLFTLLCAICFKLFTALFNPDTRRDYGKVFVAWVVWRGMLFLVPFAVMTLLATILLEWKSSGLFLSAGIMTSSTAIVMEISKYHTKPKIKNSIVLPMIASVISMGWLFSVGFLQTIPGWLHAISGVLLGNS